MNSLVRTILFFSLLCLPFLHGDEKKYNLSVCATFSDEAPYLEEWIEYHKMLGVDHFYLYNTGAYSKARRVLAPYIANQTVTLTRWHAPVKEDDQGEPYLWSLITQIPAYENVKLVSAHETKWLVFLNVDEFLVPLQEKKLTSLLEKYDDHPGITLSSDYFEAYKVDPLL